MKLTMNLRPACVHTWCLAATEGVVSRVSFFFCSAAQPPTYLYLTLALSLPFTHIHFILHFIPIGTVSTSLLRPLVL